MRKPRSGCLITIIAAMVLLIGGMLVLTSARAGSRRTATTPYIPAPFVEPSPAPGTVPAVTPTPDVEAQAVVAEPTSTCPAFTAQMTLAITPTTVQIGDSVTITAQLKNQGCGILGLPQYRLYVAPDTQSLFEPAVPPPVTHGLGVSSGKTDSVAFVLQAVRVGQAAVHVGSSFEFHLGYPGPAVWGGSSTEPATITVSDSSISPTSP